MKSIDEIFQNSSRKLIISILLFQLVSTIACKQGEKKQTITQHKLDEIPKGWKLNSRKVQMLARSYPEFHWMTLIIRYSESRSFLFQTPFPAPIDTTPKNNKMRGFRIQYQSNRNTSLVIHIPHYFEDEGYITTHACPIDIDKTKGKWRTIRVLFIHLHCRMIGNSGFVNISPASVPFLLFWNSPSKNKHKKRSSVTLTLREPKPILLNLQPGIKK